MCICVFECVCDGRRGSGCDVRLYFVCLMKNIKSGCERGLPPFSLPHWHTHTHPCKHTNTRIHRQSHVNLSVTTHQTSNLTVRHTLTHMFVCIPEHCMCVRVCSAVFCYCYFYYCLFSLTFACAFILYKFHFIICCIVYDVVSFSTPLIHCYSNTCTHTWICFCLCICVHCHFVLLFQPNAI